MAYILHLETLRVIAFPANLVVFALATLALSVLFEKFTLDDDLKDRTSATWKLRRLFLKRILQSPCLQRLRSTAALTRCYDLCGAAK
jgi:hypothetical protein